MRRAIVSDIHGNLEALNRVLEDAKSQDCEQIVCLGDIVGYGPDPQACIDIVKGFDACILGNHDLAALFDPEGFSNAAEQAILWTRRQIEAGDTPQDCYRRLEFLAHLPRTRREGPLLFVHGSVRNPINDDVFPEDIYNQRKMQKIFELIERHCFQGHTHVPGVFTQSLNFMGPEEVNYVYRLTEDKTMINVGSVGQPRDGDPRSCYVVLEDEQVTFRRVEYPFEQTIQKIYATPELDNFLGDRLREGR